MYLLLATGAAKGSVFYLFIRCWLLQRPWAKSSTTVKQHDQGSRETSGELLQLIWTIWLPAKYLSILLQLKSIDSILTYFLASSLTIFLHGVIQGDCCAVVHTCSCSGASPCACPYGYSNTTLRNNNLPVKLSCSQLISTWAQDTIDSGNTLWVYIYQHPGLKGPAQPFLIPNITREHKDIRSDISLWWK